MRKGGYIYILTNNKRNVLYIGLTSDIKERMFQYKTGTYKGFTYKYNCNLLMYYEFYPDVKDAVVIEFRMKKWRRIWKEELIDKNNPEWRDLSIDWFDENGNLKLE